MLKYKFKEIVYGYVDTTKPVLLGLSGGPDSLALLYLLADYTDLVFAVAHIDHGWRAESADEAAQLRKEVEGLSRRFYLKVLNPSEIVGNKEEFCRNQRLAFFKEICLSHGYQGVILGHHADDQVETVLKRVLEGASMVYLGGMKPISYQGELTILRPLLNTSREEILSFVEEKNLRPIQDSTNLDPKYLRARFRTATIPFLKEQFGKNITKSLLSLSNEAKELEEYLDQKISHLLDRAVTGAMGIFLDLSEGCPKEKVELCHLLKRFCSPHFSLSKHQYNTLCVLLKENAANRSIISGEGTLFVDRCRLFLMKKKVPEFFAAHSLSYGTHVCGEWTVTVSEVIDETMTKSSWIHAWEGCAQIVIPEGEYTIDSCLPNENYPRTHAISKWWTDHKVPAFLRPLVPIIRNSTGIQYEFLTGKSEELSLNKPKMLITIEL